MPLRLLDCRGSFDELLTRQMDRPALKFDFSAQLIPTPWMEPSTFREPAFGHLKPVLSQIACLRERATLLLEEPAAHRLLL